MPPCARMSAGTRSSAITDTAPASSAMRACCSSVTSMITPPLNISARPVFSLSVPFRVSFPSCIARLLTLPGKDRQKIGIASTVPGCSGSARSGHLSLINAPSVATPDAISGNDAAE